MDPSKDGLEQFGSKPNPEGNLELRLVKIEGENVTLLEDPLEQSRVEELKEKYCLDIDSESPWFQSLEVACDVFDQARTQSKDILIYVHGYNNDIYDIVETMKTLEEAYGVIIVGFTWPANGGGQLTGTLAYKSDKKDARASVGALDRFIGKLQYYHELITERTQEQLKIKATEKHPSNPQAAQALYTKLLGQVCNTKVSLLCHSMGNYLLKHSTYSSDSSTLDLVFDNIALVAADANSENHKVWVNKLQARHRIYVVINENDYALGWSRRKVGKAQRARLGHYLKDLNADNAYYIDVTDAPKVDNSHSYFADEAIEQNYELKKLFSFIFKGEKAEKELNYNSSLNVYVI